MFVLQALRLIHQVVGGKLGDRTAAWLYDRLTPLRVRTPAGGTSRIRRSAATLTSCAVSGGISSKLSWVHLKRSGPSGVQNLAFLCFVQESNCYKGNRASA